MSALTRPLLLLPLALSLAAQFSSIDDRFADGNSQNQDLANGSMRVFNGRANTVRTDAVGSVRFSQIGTSSEGFWVHFADRAVALNVGDRLTVGATFSLEGFSPASGQDLRFGIFDSKQTRTNANLTGGMNSPVFADDTGYGGAFFASGTGAPFQLFRRSTLPGNNNPFLSFADFTELPGSGARERAPLADGVAYTWTLTVERTQPSSTKITVSFQGDGLENMTYTAVETNPDPATQFDLFALRITNNSFANGFIFTRFYAKYTPAAPQITSNPTPNRLSVSAGSDVSLAVGAAGAALRYQWRRNGAALEGKNEPVLRLEKVRTEESGRYDVVVSNDGGEATSDPVSLTVVDGPVGPGPRITAQPQDQRVVTGGAAAFRVTAEGPELEYQWFRNGGVVAGARGPALTIASAAVSDAGVYSVVVSNPNGTVTSAGAALTVVSPLRLLSTAPRAGQAELCTDPRLTFALSGPVTAGRAGRIRVVGPDGADAAVIDMAVLVAAKNIGGSTAAFRYTPVLIDGDRVSVILPGPLPPGQTYSVLMDTGVLIDAGGAPFAGIADRAEWRFTTRLPRPGVPNPPRLSVAADGTGDYCTIQGAIDSVAENNPQRVFIDVAPGRYEEILFVRSTRPLISIRGADRFATVVAYPNNNNMNPTVATRAMVSVEAADFVLENLTLWNTTPKGGSQAEALRLSGPRALVSRVNLKSFQDTLLVTGSALVRDSYIEGDVDYIWGDGSAYFLRTEIRTLTSGGVITQIRNPQGRVGFVFVECYLTAAPGVTNTFLSRIAPDTFPYSQVAFLWSLMDSHITPQGWQLNNNAREATPANYPNIRFWEHAIVDAERQPLNRAGRHPLSREISAEEAGQLATPSFVLNGWEPPAAGAATVVLSGLRQTYTGAPLRPLVATDPPGLAVELLFNGAPDPPVNAGTYTVTARVTEAGYTAEQSGTFVIVPAPVLVSLENMTQRGDGTPRAATVRTAPAGVAVDVTYEGSAAAPSGEGSYLVEARIRDANYTGGASGVLTITPNRAVAFPGAEGFGAYTLGGRGGDVYQVTTLADSGEGSLRQGIQTANGPRTIVFAVSGTIELRSRLSINKSNLTLAGQTAPGDGITIRGFGTVISRASHVVVRYLRFRMGDANCPNVQDDALSVDQASDVILDHVSASWSVDETLSVTDSNRVTVQWATIAESLSRSCHAEGAHGYGTLLRAFDGKLSTISFHHNLFAHHSNRSPRVGDTVNLDFVNNVVYDWGGDAGYSGGAEEGITRVNYTGNALIAGTSTNAGARTRAFRGGSVNTLIHASRNWIDSNTNGQRDGADTGAAMIQGAFTAIEPRFDFPAVTASDAVVAMEQVLTRAGASRPRDAVDSRIVNAVRTGQGGLIDSQSQVGGWPALNSRPGLPDTDGDGIPDAVETAAGLSPNDRSDGARVAANGYTNLENYLNSLVTP